MYRNGVLDIPIFFFRGLTYGTNRSKLLGAKPRCLRCNERSNNLSVIALSLSIALTGFTAELPSTVVVLFFHFISSWVARYCAD